MEAVGEQVAKRVIVVTGVHLAAHRKDDGTSLPYVFLKFSDLFRGKGLYVAEKNNREAVKVDVVYLLHGTDDRVDGRCVVASGVQRLFQIERLALVDILFAVS